MAPEQAKITPQAQELLGGKHAYDLVSDDTKIMENGQVIGTLKYVTGYEAFSSNAAERKGYYFPVTLGEKYQSKKIKCVGKNTKTAVDTEWLLLVKDQSSTFKFTNETDGGAEILTLKFEKAVFQKG